MYVNLNAILLFRFFICLFFLFFFFFKELLSVQSLSSSYTLSFVTCCLYLISLPCSLIYHSYSWIYCLLNGYGEDGKFSQMVFFILKNHGVLIYNLNELFNWILSCRVWSLVYLMCFINDSIWEICLSIKKIKVNFRRWVGFINLLIKFHWNYCQYILKKCHLRIDRKV